MNKPMVCPLGWSTSNNKWGDELGTSHLSLINSESNITFYPCGYKGIASGQVEKQATHKCKKCLNKLQSLIKSLDESSPSQCEFIMKHLNSESRNDVEQNIEFYREHCRYLVSDLS